MSQLGHLAEALPVAEEAAAVHRELAAANPDRYRPNLTRSLARLARIYEELGQTANAASVRTEVAEVADTNQ